MLLRRLFRVVELIKFCLPIKITAYFTVINYLKTYLFFNYCRFMSIENQTLNKPVIFRLINLQ